MGSSAATTRGVRVDVRAKFSPAHSQPELGHWFFLYTVVIENQSDETVQLVTRHWIITDAAGQVEEVRGPGVVGQQPVLEPGDTFEYTSGCPFTSPWGRMKGSYQMIGAGGETFDAEIAEFSLEAPYVVH